jgi:hypothetical protein
MSGVLDFTDCCDCGGALYIGEAFNRSMTWTIDDVPVNLTGATALMQVRTAIGVDPVVIELSTTNNRITLSSVGVITMHIDADDVALIAPGTYLYDLFITIGTEPEQILRGKFQVRPSVTEFGT